MSQRNLAWLLVVPAVVLAGGTWSFTAPPPDGDYQRVRTLVDVLAEVDKNYYRELSADDKRQLVEEMINGGLARLDHYSEYFNEDRLKQFDRENQGTFGGIGAILDTDPASGRVRVGSPLPDSPAFEAGVRPGDLIVKIDGAGTDGLDEGAVRARLRGKEGAGVTLTLDRAGGDKPFDVTLVRRLIQNPSVKGVRRTLDDPKRWEYLLDPQAKVALVRVSEFTRGTAKELKAALAECDAAGATSLILDLRGNPGGLLDVSEAVADLFLADGFIVHTRGRGDAKRDIKAGNDGSVWEDKSKRPVAVLVNGGSASAAEIVAAALQENGRAVVVGSHTYGKGSVQTNLSLPDGKTSLKLTTQKWLTPAERQLDRPSAPSPDERWGVIPDAGLEVTLTREQAEQTALHARAADYVRVKDAPAPAPVDPKVAKGPVLDPKFVDPVVAKAVEYLKK